MSQEQWTFTYGQPVLDIVTTALVEHGNTVDAGDCCAVAVLNALGMRADTQ